MDKPSQDMAEMQAQLDTISKQLETLLRQQTFYRDFIDEFSPILAEVMGVGANHLQEVENKGYFTFAKHMAKIANKVVEAYDETDLEQLGDNVVYIVDTLRSFTQPDILAIANEATAALQDDTSKSSKSIFGMLKASRNDDVRLGMSVMLNVLKHVGKATKKTRPKRSDRMRRLERKTAPSQRQITNQNQPKTNKQEAKQTQPKTAVSINIPGFEMTPEGFLVDPNAWTKGFAASVASAMNYSLTDDHWALIEWARNDFAQTNASPNVRKIGKNSPVTTKELYAMFPKAPALEAARIAGLPKPVGCI